MQPPGVTITAATIAAADTFAALLHKQIILLLVPLILLMLLPCFFYKLEAFTRSTAITDQISRLRSSIQTFVDGLVKHQFRMASQLLTTCSVNGPVTVQSQCAKIITYIRLSLNKTSSSIFSHKISSDRH